MRVNLSFNIRSSLTYDDATCHSSFFVVVCIEVLFKIYDLWHIKIIYRNILYGIKSKKGQDDNVDGELVENKTKITR